MQWPTGLDPSTGFPLKSSLSLTLKKCSKNAIFDDHSSSLPVTHLNDHRSYFFIPLSFPLLISYF